MSNLHIKNRVAPSIKTGDITPLEDGPGKYDLMRGLFDPHNYEVRKVALRTSGGVILAATVGAVRIEDGSGDCFVFKGVCVGDGARRPYEAFIRTNTRKGWIMFLND